MNTFEIYTPIKKIYYTNNRIVYTSMIVGLLPMAFEQLILRKEEVSSFSNFFIGITLTAFFIGIVLSGYSMIKYRPLKGIIEGKITFDMDKVIAHEEEFLIADLVKISFSQYADYLGRDNGFSKGDFNGKLSQGVDNVVELHVEGGKIVKYYFQLYRPYQIRDIQDQLISYHNAGKLHFLNLIDILGIEDYNMIQNFKKTLNT